MSDNELIQRYLLTQDTSAFGVLYKRYANRVYCKCITLLRDEGEAQDAMQDIFMKIFLNLSAFSEKSKFSTWIYSISYNYCIDLLRKRKKDKGIFSEEMDNPPDTVDDADDYLILEIETERLRVILDKIPEGDRAILMMKYQDELSIREIAEALEKTESAIKMKIKRAKEKAQTIYQELFADTII
ncbi:MAG: RNA polymerase sigma factor [Saprospiraceae bacterium]|nr:RNA polymerase sigma factor [Saprospiraceae bacterium]MBP7699755.1 RNA polymerase sigma factor [Saprospiraceae bacterium]